MMRLRFTTAGSIVMILGLFLLSSCAPFFNSQAGQKATGRLSLTASVGGSAKTILPVLPTIDHYTITLVAVNPTGTAEIIERDPGTDTSFTMKAEIPVGDWTIQVNAYTGADEGTTLIGASEAKQVTISPRGTTPVSVLILPIASGTGSLYVEWDLSQLQAGQVDGGTVSLSYFPGGGDAMPAGITPTFVPNSSAPTSVSLVISSDPGLAAGTYILVLQLSKSAANLAPITEIVQIYGNLTSSKTITVTANELSHAPAAPTGVSLIRWDGTQFELSWTAPSPNTATGYALYSDIDSFLTPFATISSATQTSYAFPVATGQIFSVRAVNGFGETAAPDVYFYAGPSYMLLSQNSAHLFLGNGLQLSNTLYNSYNAPVTSHRVTWSSSDTNVATVDSTGYVTAVGRGAATITAISNVNSELQAQCGVLVTGKADLSFFAIGNYPGIISGSNVTVTMPMETNLTSLIADFASTGSGVSVVGSGAQTSGVSANNFTNPVTYRVLAYDSSVTDYTVSVVLARLTAASYSATGSEQLFVVPAGVTSLFVDVMGAQGAASYSGIGSGLGGRVGGTITVTPGETLYLYVGGQNGWNGGGTAGTPYGYYGRNGGGASDIRQVDNTITDRIVVAGGGGGLGGNAIDPPSYFQSWGGDGGGLLGSPGHNGDSTGLGAGGAQSVGGIAFPPEAGIGAGWGSNGGLGIGGNGGNASASAQSAGGGGGGGYYGGAGGAAGTYGSGGGGGSSLVPTGGSTMAGYRNGDGQIVISWIAPISLTMAAVEGGTFNNGVSDVTVSSFLMSAYEVTQAQYTTIIGNSPAYYLGPNRPVENVTWYDAVEFCNQLSESEGLIPAYTISGRTLSGIHITAATVTLDMTKNGYRLPTEAEWTWAAMGGLNDCRPEDIVNSVNTGGYLKGYAGSSEAGTQQANINNYAVLASETAAVGTKAANELGIFDMSGNVWEWCWDWYGAYPVEVQTDPTGAASGTLRAIRGGRFYSSAAECAVSFRGSLDPANGYGDYGFRVVRRSSP